MNAEQTARELITAPRLKKFDLRVGDCVFAPPETEWQSGNARHLWKVVAVFPHIFACVDRKGHRTTFMRVEYQLGEITRREICCNN